MSINQSLFEKHKLVAVVRATADTDVVGGMVALVAGGVRILEITFTVPNAIDMIRATKATLGKQAIVGAGTVTNVEQARAAITAGAAFLVTPGLSLDVFHFARGHGVTVIPGVFTPTEVMAGLNAGADLIKLFPAEPLGIAYLKTLLGPFPQAKFMATGGLDLSNVATYMASGAVAVGVGSSMVDPVALRNKDAATLTVKAQQYMAAVHPQGVPAWSM